MDIPRPSEAGGSCQPRLGLPPHEDAAPAGGAAQYPLPRPAPHLRTHALTSGVDAKTLSGILGHTNASFTLDTYTHVTSDMQKTASGIVGGFMEDIFGKELKPWQENEKPETER